jgi:hypothetical protein
MKVPAFGWALPVEARALVHLRAINGNRALLGVARVSRSRASKAGVTKLELSDQGAG